MAAHAKLSPSGASIWANCAGAIEAQEAYPDDSGYPAAEGTCAHAVQEICLNTGKDPHRLIGRKFYIVNFDRRTAKMTSDFVVEVTEEMADFLLPVIDSIRDTKGKHYYETRVSTERWLGPDQFGTLDVGIIQPQHIIVRDLKYGFIPVSPVENKQTQIYTLGFWDTIARHVMDAPPRKVTIIIDQPRATAGGGEWTVSWSDLMDFGHWIERRAKRVAPGAPRTAGLEQCTWCKARNDCEEWAAFKLELWGAKFPDLDGTVAPKLPDASQLTPERRSYLIKHGPAISAWFTQLHATALQDALSGKPTPGLKAVLGKKPNRAWTSERKAKAFLLDHAASEEEIYAPRKMISPAGADKLLGKEFKDQIKDLVSQGDARPVLVPEQDNRPAVQGVVERFEDLDTEGFE